MKAHYMIAVCDILGFSNLIDRNPLDMVVDRALGWFERHSITRSIKTNFLIISLKQGTLKDMNILEWHCSLTLFFSTR